MSATYAPGAPVRSSPLLDLQAEPPLTCLQQYALASKVARVYLALATLESAALLSITGLILGNHRKESDSVQYMAVLSIYMTLLFVYFTWDAIIRENVFQFATSALMHGVICAFGKFLSLSFFPNRTPRFPRLPLLFIVLLPASSSSSPQWCGTQSPRLWAPPSTASLSP